MTGSILDSGNVRLAHWLLEGKISDKCFCRRAMSFKGEMFGFSVGSCGAVCDTKELRIAKGCF